jgi:hypothetical protein
LKVAISFGHLPEIIPEGCPITLEYFPGGYPINATRDNLFDIPLKKLKLNMKTKM